MPNILPWPRKQATERVRLAEIARDLAKNNQRLFAPPYSSELEIKVAELSSQGAETFCFYNEGEFREHLSIYHDPATRDSPKNDDSGDTRDGEMRASMFIIEPAYGWGHLAITRDGMTSLLTSLDASPSIYRYLTAFGRKRFARDEGFAGFGSDITLDSSGTLVSFELCYLLKYMALREDATPGTNPWSIRHALIHQKINLASNRVSNLLIRIPPNIADLLGDITKENHETRDLARDWTWLHIQCLSSVDHGLRQSINYLDDEITKFFDRVIMSALDTVKLNDFDPPEQMSKDLKTLQYFSDQARRIINVIELNLETIRHLQSEVVGLKAMASLGPTHGPSADVLCSFLEKIQREHNFSLKSSSAVLGRVKGTFEQLRDMASLRSSEISKMTSEQTNMSTVNTAAMAQFAEQSSREAHVVKTLSPRLGLCASFIRGEQEEPMRWAAKADLKIYATLAIPLIGVTMLIYGCVKMMQRKRK
ncbi:hypothetical protein NCS56_01005500 [Fusarium sp. Ph1]|nr:hypothetical protein NCS56_01005500 [Fusarium sp. Ph1]